MCKFAIVLLAAASAMFTFASVQAAEPAPTTYQVDCKKPPEPPKGSDGKPLPPPEGKQPPMGKDGKPLPPPDGCKPLKEGVAPGK